MPTKKEVLTYHKNCKGKFQVVPNVKIETMEDLSLAYTPGVAEPCKEIEKDRSKVYDYTRKWNTVAVISDGTAVLGLGDIGPFAALPVMEGKAVLFKTFADIDAIPICLATTDTEQIIKTVRNIAPSFGGINLEDISAPRCFIIEEELKKGLDMPIFHDDQHGTAIVVLAGLINALKLAKKKLETAKIVINGAGSAGIAIAKFLLKAGATNIVMCDKMGVLSKDAFWMNDAQQEMASITNPEGKTGFLKDALIKADVLVGVSAPNAVTPKMVSKMARNAIVFAMANPIPEIMPEEAKAAGAKIIGTGRSDYPNQINNVLAFPGIFRGALDTRAYVINDEMMIAAAYAIAELVKAKELSPDYIIPSPLDERVAKMVAKRVSEAAIATQVATIDYERKGK